MEVPGVRMTKLQQVMSAIDAANAHDPGRDEATGKPASLLYGEHMSARLDAFAPDADDALAIAVRGQHIERWTVPRKSSPMDRPGYLRWRNVLKDHHAQRLGELMLAAGYDDAAISRVKQIVRKERFKLDPQAQTLEDVACLVFLEFYAPEFFAKHDEAKSIDIVSKTWAKMSSRGQDYARTMALAPAVAHIVARALEAGQA